MTTKPPQGSPNLRAVAGYLPFWLVLAAALGITACYTPQASQTYFREAAVNDPALELIYSTPLYSVYFDHALRRCVLHASHTWGQQGGGGGGTGVGLTAFRCDPIRVGRRAQQVYMQLEDLKDPGRSPPPAQPVGEVPQPIEPAYPAGVSGSAPGEGVEGDKQTGPAEEKSGAAGASTDKKGGQ